MVRCSVKGCRSDSGTKMPGLSFHSFPEPDNLRWNWILATGRIDWTPKPSSKICSRHFEKEMFIKKKKLTLLFPNAVPILALQPEIRPANPPVTFEENPLYLENEPMEAIDQDSDDTLSIKSESLSMASDGFKEDNGDIQVKSKKEETDRDVREIDDRDENYEDEDDDESDITGSLTCSSSDSESYEEMPIPIPTTMAPSATMVAATSSASNPTAAPNNAQADKQKQMLLRQKQKLETKKKKIKCLQSQVRRKEKIIQSLKEQMGLVKKYTECSEIENILRGNYRKLCLAINKNGVPVNYSDDVIKFAITLNYYSPKSYEFIRKYISLPNTRMLEKYVATGTYIIDLDD